MRTLYLPPGGSYCGCRHCYRLVYRSSQEHDKNADRRLTMLLERVDRLTARHEERKRRQDTRRGV